MCLCRHVGDWNEPSECDLSSKQFPIQPLLKFKWNILRSYLESNSDVFIEMKLVIRQGLLCQLDMVFGRVLMCLCVCVCVCVVRAGICPVALSENYNRRHNRADTIWISKWESNKGCVRQPKEVLRGEVVLKGSFSGMDLAKLIEFFWHTNFDIRQEAQPKSLLDNCQQRRRQQWRRRRPGSIEKNYVQ